MALTTAADYHFANVAGIDISGEVLPQHPDYWQVNLGEDWAFLLEAAGERLAIRDFCTSVDGDGNHRTMSEAEARVKSSYFRREVYQRPYVVADRYQMEMILSVLANYVLGIMPMGGEWGERWCSGIPTEKTWNGDGPGDDPYELFPELYPVTLTPAMVDNIASPWTVDILRAAYADLTARQYCFIPGSYWFAQNMCSTSVTNSSGQTYTIHAWQGDYEYIGHDDGTDWWSKSIPSPINDIIVPPGIGSDGKMITLWTSDVYGEGAKKTRLRVTSPSYDFGGDIVAYLPSSGRTRTVSGTIVGYIAEASNMRTYLVG